MSQNYEKLKTLLKELFQLDQPDLDFGFYRIMHAKSAEVSEFLDKDLLPQVKAGRLRALAVTSEARSPLAPDIPTVMETGLNYVATTWYGILAPAGTPRNIIDRLNRDARALLEDPAMKAQLAPQGVVLTPSTPEEFGAFIRAEVAKWAKVVRDSGATPD